jgi:3'-phosphoadenosine 5'-phosphosulfate sulfotransferase (PAPS reductase)/FAD synthetase
MPYPLIDFTDQVQELLAGHVPVAFGLSGGCDGIGAALALSQYLDALGHQGPRIAIHSDLGVVEHRDSLPMCQQAAGHLGIPLVVVRRQKGDLLDRWKQRWQDNLARYAALLCVQLILPWSTASMRFCSSEMKTAIICRDLVERFQGQTIISALGIRAEESTTRALMPIVSPQTKLVSKTFATTGFNYHPIHSWTKQQVFDYHQWCQFPTHEAYWRWGMSRVSCIFCILSSLSDLIAASKNPEHHELYREMVWLEIISAFSFQPERWLGDVATHLLPDEMKEGLTEAKRKAQRRAAIEAKIPAHLLYTRDWPTTIPTWEEAGLLSEIRLQIAQIMGLRIDYTEPHAIQGRYSELIEEKARRDREKAKQIAAKGSKVRAA